MFEIKNLTLKKNGFELKNISFKIEKGDYMVIIGPSGSGKSMLLNAVLGFENVTKGDILVNFQSIVSLPVEKRKIGIVYQEYLLFEHMNVFQNIKYGAKDSTKSRVYEIAGLLNITSLLDKRVKNLSGGEKQRVAIARALIAEPELLLLDEPFSALDNITKSEIRKEIKKIVKKLKISVIHITHDMEDVWIMADKVGVIKNGEMLQFGSVEYVSEYPMNNVVADFFNVNLFDAEIKRINGKTFFNIGGELFAYNAESENVKEGYVKIALKANGFSLEKNQTGSLRVKVESVEEKEFFYLLRVSKEDLKFFVLLEKEKYKNMLNKEYINLYIKPDKIKIVRS